MTTPLKENQIFEAYQKEWEDELNKRLSNVEYIEELIIVNEYYFLEDGSHV